MHKHERNYGITAAKKGCKRCGSKTVAWQEGQSGKWYLTEIFEDGYGGHEFTARTDFHSTYCGKPELHAQKQAEITQTDQAAEAASNQRAEDARAARENADRERKDALRQLSLLDQYAALNERQAEMAAYQRNPPTMDYMTEFTRAIARAEVVREEIQILREEIGLD